MSFTWLLLNAAYAVYTASALFKDILYLRVTLLAATVLFMSYGIAGPNWSVFFWSIPVGLLHIYGIWQLMKSRRGIDLDDEAEAIHTLMFAGLSRTSFNIFWHLGQERTITDQVLITKGEPVHELSLILDGELNVEVNESYSVRLSQYRIIGEISSFTGGLGTATVSALGGVRLRSWNKKALQECGEKHPEIQVALLHAMGHEAARKVT
jgi:hypothetical protein